MPGKIKLERFEKKGVDQKLISFGIGRRACPGSGFSSTVSESGFGIVGSVLRVGESWKRNVDMSDTDAGHV